MSPMPPKFTKRRKERGVTSLEYAVIAGVLVVALIGIFQALGTNIGTLFTNITTAISSGINP